MIICTGDTVEAICWTIPPVISVTHVMTLTPIMSVTPVMSITPTMSVRAGSEKIKPLCDIGVKNSNFVYLYNVFSFGK